MKTWVKIFIWLAATILVFILQPLYLEHFPLNCLFICIRPDLLLLAGVDLIWILTGFFLFIPRFTSKIANIIRLVLILILAVVLIAVVPFSRIINYPFALYKYYTRPQIFILEMRADDATATGRQYELLWNSKNIPTTESLTVFYQELLPLVDGHQSAYEDVLGVTQNTGEYKFSFDPTDKNGQYLVGIGTPNYMNIPLDYDFSRLWKQDGYYLHDISGVWTKIPINVSSQK